MNIVIFVLILIVGIVVGAVWVSWKEKTKSNKQSDLIYGQVKTKQENKEKILEFLKSNEKVANNDVEKITGVSDATAERYLNELEDEGKIKQIGKIGREYPLLLIKIHGILTF